MHPLTSTFTWLDHSEDQRKRMMEVVGLFQERGTLDELGIGAVRDAISDLLFPGTSTLHTRARYLLFLPWIFLRLENERVPSRDAAERARRDEIRLIYALDRGRAGDGIIGIEARERLRQMPSMVYWTALGRYGIRRVPITRAQYLRSLDNHYTRLRVVQDIDDTEARDRAPRNWHGGIPPAPSDFLDETSFDLAETEADYLAERIRDRCRGSFLAHLVSQSDASTNADAPWFHAASPPSTSRTAEHLDHAHAFSLVMHGATLLYNLILAEKVREARSQGGDTVIDPGAADDYRERLDAWAQRMEERSRVLARWDITRFWALARDINPRIPPRTQAFVNRWISLALADPVSVTDDRGARALITEREIAVKRGLARVANPRALERWSGRSGFRPLEFRWPQVRQIVADIVAGATAPTGVSDA